MKKPKPPTVACPTCGKAGYRPTPAGRKPILDDAQVAHWRARGWTYQKIADKYGVTRQAVFESLKRSKAASQT